MKSLVSLILKSSPCNLSYSTSWKLPCLEGRLNGICDWLQSLNRPVYKCSFIKILPFPKILLNNSNDDFPVALFVFFIYFLEEMAKDSLPYFPHFLCLHVLSPHSGTVDFLKGCLSFRHSEKSLWETMTAYLPRFKCHGSTSDKGWP